MKIDSVTLSEIPELKHDFMQDSRGQSFDELEESWQKVVTEPDAEDDEIDALFNREEDSWESYLDYYDGWLNPAYEQAGPPSTFDLGFKAFGDDNHYIGIIYDKQTRDIVCWVMDID